jgi:hypothetical protein
MTMRPFLTIAILLPLMFFSLIACQPADQQHYPPARFTHKVPYKFEMGQFSIGEEFISPLSKPNIEHLAPVTPARHLKQWAQDRMVITQTGQRHLRMAIKDASIIEKKVTNTHGQIKDIFIKQQVAEYVGRIEVILEVFDKDPLFPASELKVELKRSLSVSQGSSLAEKEKLLHELSVQLIHDFDIEIEKRIAQTFVSYLAP